MNLDDLLPVQAQPVERAVFGRAELQLDVAPLGADGGMQPSAGFCACACVCFDDSDEA